MQIGFQNRTAFDAYDEGRGEFILLRPLAYVSRSGERFDVHAGFITDFSSYPAFVRAVYGVNDETRYAAILHDYLYRVGIVSRKRADELYREALEFCGTRASKRSLLFVGLRVGGWRHYKRSKVPLMLPVEYWPKYGLERLYAATDSSV